MRDVIEEAFEFAEENNLTGTERVSVWIPAVRRMALEFAARMSLASMWCGSPVEEMFLAALLSSDRAVNVVLLDPEGNRHFLTDNPDYPERYLVQPQFRVGRYRCDFLITMKWNEYQTSVVVEIDGHEFHEKTKQQVSKDKARERSIVSSGYRVLRFSGSDVFNNALPCADEVFALLGALMTKATSS